ncbi:MAG: endonuclease domain-containing protein [Clostridia bacterium]|nr:endonuclease domain-containing protein [Clostridia bacterium]
MLARGLFIGGITLDRKHNKELVPFAKNLRKGMTKEEKHLWYDFLRTYPVKFLKQKILGKYIVDFYCAKAKIIIELDGSQHYEDDAILKDLERTKYLEQYGLKILRIPNNQLNQNFEGVCEYIDKEVKQSLHR